MEENLWYNLETRVRKLVSELIEPTIRRTLTNNEEIEKIAKTSEETHKRIEEVILKTDRLESKTEIIDKYSAKIIEFESYIGSMRENFKKDREYVMTQVQTFEKKLSHTDETISMLDQQRKLHKSELNDASSKIVDVENSFNQEVEALRENTKHKTTQLTNEVSKLQEKVANIQQRLPNINNDITELDGITKKSEHMINELKDQVKSITKTIRTHRKSSKEEVDRIRNMCIKFDSKIQEKLKNLKQYVSHDNIANVNMTISEFLHNSINDPHSLRNLAEFEQKKFSELNTPKLPESIRTCMQQLVQRAQEIIETPLPVQRPQVTPGSSKSSLSQLLSNRSKRKPSKNSHSSIADSGGNSARDYILTEDQEEGLSVEYQAQEAFLENQSEETLQEDLDSEEEGNYSIKVLSSESESESGKPVEIPQSHELYTKIDELKEAIEEIKNYQTTQDQTSRNQTQAQTESITALQNQLQELQQLQKETNQTLELYVFAEDHNEFQNQVNKKLQELELRTDQFSSECSALVSQRKRDLSDINTNIRLLRSNIDNITQEKSSLHQHIVDLKRGLDNVVQVSKITCKLLGQDEADKESISLIGQKSTPLKSRPTTKSGRAPVSLERSCLSCSGNSSSITSAFKMACLAYYPSPVKYLGKSYSRKEMIEIQCKILEAVLEEKERPSTVGVPNALRPISGLSLYKQTPSTALSPLRSPFFQNE